MPSSHSETLLKTILKTTFPMLEMVENIRPTALPNRYNGQGKAQHRRYGLELENLELDVYFPQIRVACEWQGEQHLRPVAHFHAPRMKRSWWQRVRGVRPKVDRPAMLQAFRDGLERDRRKAELCAAQGVLLIPFDHGDRQGTRLATKLDRIVQWGMASSNDPVLAMRLRTVDPRRPLSAVLMATWDRLARPGVRSSVRTKGLTTRRKT